MVYVMYMYVHMSQVEGLRTSANMVRINGPDKILKASKFSRLL